MPMKKRDVVSGLKNKGFVEKSSHHIRLIYMKDGKKECFTKVSHGHNEIDDSLISKMADQVHLSKSEFEDLVECPLSQKEYEEKLEDYDPYPELDSIQKRG